MTYHYLTHSTTASAADMVDNFEHIGVGDCLPLGASMLVETTGVYNLGSATYRWNNLFCQNIDIYDSITADGNLWALESEITIDESTASIEFSGLSGDTAKEYLITSRILVDDAAGGVLMVFNQDSGTNYGYHYLHSGLVLWRVQNTIGHYLLNYVHSDATGFAKIIINAGSGTERTTIGITDNECTGGEDIFYLTLYTGIWNNTADEITSIKIISASSYMTTNTSICLWKRA